ncbi:unnamed protein product [Urochloa decumbens]|uniref:NAC domain-containing protein n=1 Tax=Urochloa decumbens TaxID=240449 RepID=A0ABC9C8M5_9POAL
MENSWIMTGVGFANKIRNVAQLIRVRLGDLFVEPYIKCPYCKCDIDTSNVSLVWPALPAGVKFDPTDFELLQHLQGKSSQLNSNSHALIDEFIPTIENMDGICYTHPKNLPGIKMDGSSVHFFHRVSNAYGRGHRKRRKISGDDGSVCDEHIRWHKTGASKPIYDENGVLKGWKKILVLYKGSKKGDRDNWVMYQYHLGANKDEEDGEFVISKLFYQLSKKNDMPASNDVVVESEASVAKIDPTTPKTDPPQRRPLNNSPCDTEQYIKYIQVDQHEEECSASACPVKVEPAECSAWLDESSSSVVVADLPALDEPRQPGDTMDTGPEPEAHIPVDGSNTDLFHGLPELDTTSTSLGSPSDGIGLADIPFGSQDSFTAWLDNFLL